MRIVIGAIRGICYRLVIFELDKERWSIVLVCVFVIVGFFVCFVIFIS